MSTWQIRGTRGSKQVAFTVEADDHNEAVLKACKGEVFCVPHSVVLIVEATKKESAGSIPDGW